MHYRKVGPLEVSAIGLGCMGLSQSYGVQDEASSIHTLHRALELGVNFFDTAEVYGPLRNEQLLGQAFSHLPPERALIATKFGFVYDRQRSDYGEVSGTDGRPENARAVAHASLKRLKREAIDLYYLHRADPAVPIEDTVGAMAELVREGKVRAIGLSEVNAETLRRAHAVHPIAALQSEYSLWTRDVEHNAVLQTCRELGIAFVPFSPLGRGFLTGKMPAVDTLDANDMRRGLPRFQPEHVAANQRLVAVIEQLAQARGASAAQVALSWVLAQGQDIVPIPGAKRIAHLEQNVAASELQLSSDELAQLQATFAPEQVSGARYPAAIEAMASR